MTNAQANKLYMWALSPDLVIKQGHSNVGFVIIIKKKIGCVLLI